MGDPMKSGLGGLFFFMVSEFFVMNKIGGFST
jgi:hypothetical protein